MSAVRQYNAEEFSSDDGGEVRVFVAVPNPYYKDEIPYLVAVENDFREGTLFPPSLAADICAAITRAAETAAKWNAEDAAAKAPPQ